MDTWKIVFMSRGTTPRPSHSRPVLIVDDDIELRRDLCGLLADAGVPVVAASDGADALAYLRRAALKPGLLVIDLVMPGMDGFTFAAAVAKEPLLAGIPIVILSGSLVATPADLKVAERLTKPVSLDVFLDAVHRHALL